MTDTLTPPTTEAPPHDWRSQLDYLTSRCEELAASLTQRRAWHEADVAIIGAALLEQAEEQRWCSVFDDEVEKVNARLHVELPTRSRDYCVSVPLTIMVTVSVTARSEEDAHDQAQECYSANDFDEFAIEALRCRNGTLDWSCSEIEEM